MSREALHELVRAYHREQATPSDAELDRALGLPALREAFDPAGDAALMARYRGESVANLATPYPICRDVMRTLPLGAGDVVVDLGCAEGRVVLYGALTTPARFIGIELVAERAAIAARAARGIHRVTIVEGNALDHDFAVGTVFYLFRPFSEDSEAQVMQRFHEQAARRPLTVVTLRMPPGRFDPALFEPAAPSMLQIHRSRR